jgi:hypothetical protein
MSPFAQSLERRVFLSATPADVATAETAVVHEAQLIQADANKFATLLQPAFPHGLHLTARQKTLKQTLMSDAAQSKLKVQQALAAVGLGNIIHDAGTVANDDRALLNNQAKSLPDDTADTRTTNDLATFNSLVSASNLAALITAANAALHQFNLDANALLATHPPAAIVNAIHTARAGLASNLHAFSSGPTLLPQKVQTFSTLTASIVD